MLPVLHMSWRGVLIHRGSVVSLLFHHEVRLPSSLAPGIQPWSHPSVLWIFQFPHPSSYQISSIFLVNLNVSLAGQLWSPFVLLFRLDGRLLCLSLCWLYSSLRMALFKNVQFPVEEIDWFYTRSVPPPPRLCEAATSSSGWERW